MPRYVATVSGAGVHAIKDMEQGDTVCLFMVMRCPSAVMSAGRTGCSFLITACCGGASRGHVGGNALSHDL